MTSPPYRHGRARKGLRGRCYRYDTTRSAVMAIPHVQTGGDPRRERAAPLRRFGVKGRRPFRGVWGRAGPIAPLRRPHSSAAQAPKLRSPRPRNKNTAPRSFPPRGAAFVFGNTVSPTAGRRTLPRPSGRAPRCPPPAQRSCRRRYARCAGRTWPCRSPASRAPC